MQPTRLSRLAQSPAWAMWDSGLLPLVGEVLAVPGGGAAEPFLDPGRWLPAQLGTGRTGIEVLRVDLVRRLTEDGGLDVGTDGRRYVRQHLEDGQWLLEREVERSPDELASRHQGLGKVDIGRRPIFDVDVIAHQ